MNLFVCKCAHAPDQSRGGRGKFPRKQVSSMIGDQLDKVAAFKGVKFTAGQRVESKKAQIQALLAAEEPTVAQ